MRDMIKIVDDCDYCYMFDPEDVCLLSENPSITTSQIGVNGTRISLESGIFFDCHLPLEKVRKLCGIDDPEQGI